MEYLIYLLIGIIGIALLPVILMAIGVLLIVAIIAILVYATLGLLYLGTLSALTAIETFGAKLLLWVTDKVEITCVLIGGFYKRLLD